mmetsp:Transcript_10761/g.29958  ORF Transcript_10761/g.29958 Transcript_10761/m.29958 type:complete len:217 (-) Transcript_10761:431-1081(-)
MPKHQPKIMRRAKVMRQCHREIKIQNHMPPSTRHEHRLTWTLPDVDGLGIPPRFPRRLLRLWPDDVKPAHGTVDPCWLQHALRHAPGREERPALVTRDERIPSRRSQRIHVDSCARPGASNAQPPVGRAPLLAGMLEQILAEQVWDDVLPGHARLFQHVAVEYVQGRVVLQAVVGIMGVAVKVLVPQPHGVSIVVAPHLAAVVFRDDRPDRRGRGP